MHYKNSGALWTTLEIEKTWHTNLFFMWAKILPQIYTLFGPFLVSYFDFLNLHLCT